jgi:hypothetical protein
MVYQPTQNIDIDGIFTIISHGTTHKVCWNIPYFTDDSRHSAATEINSERSPQNLLTFTPNFLVTAIFMVPEKLLDGTYYHWPFLRNSPHRSFILQAVYRDVVRFLVTHSNVGVHQTSAILIWSCVDAMRIRAGDPA